MSTDEEPNVLDSTDLFTLEKLTALLERMGEEFTTEDKRGSAWRVRVAADVVGNLRDTVKEVVEDNLDVLTTDDEDDL